MVALVAEAEVARTGWIWDVSGRRNHHDYTCGLRAPCVETKGLAPTDALPRGLGGFRSRPLGLVQCNLPTKWPQAPQVPVLKERGCQSLACDLKLSTWSPHTDKRRPD